MEINQHCGNNITKFKPNSCPEYFPSNLQEIKSLIKLAKEKNYKVHPISTGRNWGLGSKESLIERKIILNLSKMNKIIECDEEFGFVIIEPGVTQEILCKYLKKINSKYFIECTGSSKDTSIIGNTLERGVTYNGLRADSLYGLEVITGKSDIFRTGQWRFKNSKTRILYKHGVGPNMTGLFLQSNLGIVTKAIIKLKRKKKYNKLIQLEYKNLENFSKSIPPFKALMEKNIIDSIYHLANSERAIGVIRSNLFVQLQTVDPSLTNGTEKLLGKIIKNGWIASGTISADSHIELLIKTKTLKKNLSPYCKISTFSPFFFRTIEKALTLFHINKYLAVLKAVKPFRMLYNGNPTDAALASVLTLESFSGKKQLDKKVDKAKTGFSYCLPITRFDQENCHDMINIINDVCKKQNLVPSITLNPITSEILEAVVSLEYSEQDAEKSHKCISKLNEVLIKKGHTPYRVDINNFDKTYDINDSHTTYLKKLKKVFDPDNLIFPGKYIPMETTQGLQNTEHLG